MDSTSLEKVKYLVPSFGGSEENPLGPDCIISHSNEADQKLLNEVDYYWYVSQSNGCVECVVKKGAGLTPTTSNPNCVITKKHRRIEAYCCMICRVSFITVVQALMHLKTVHRANRKIFIQNLDVFPSNSTNWSNSSLNELHKSNSVEMQKSSSSSMSSFQSGSSSSQTIFESSSNLLAEVAEYAKTYSAIKQRLETEMALKKRAAFHFTSPRSPSGALKNSNAKILACLAIVRSFVLRFSTSKVIALLFATDLSTVTAVFADQTRAVACSPDLRPPTTTSQSTTTTSVHDDDDDVTVGGGGKTANDLIDDEVDDRFLSFQLTEVEGGGEDESSGVDKTAATDEEPRITELSETATTTTTPPPQHHLLLVPSNPQQAKKILSSFAGKTISMTGDTAGCVTDTEADDKSKYEAGLQQVVDSLIATASGGLQSMSVAPTATVKNSGGDQQLATFPLVSSSVPSLTSLINSKVTSSGGADATIAATTKNPLLRVQSWGSGTAATSFSPMIRPYTARAFTYAEKIEMMKQQNDFDSEYVAKHFGVTSTASATSGESGTSSSTTNSIAISPSVLLLQQQQQQLAQQQHHEKLLLHAVAAAANRTSPALTASTTAQGGEKSEEDRHSNDSRYNQGRSSRSNSGDTVEHGDNGEMDRQSPTHSMSPNGTPQSAVFPSEYYGSGEWATTAMATLQNLQHAMDQQRHQRNNPFTISFPTLLSAGRRLPTAAVDSTLLYEAITSNAAAVAAAAVSHQQQQANSNAAPSPTMSHEHNNSNNNHSSNQQQTTSSNFKIKMEKDEHYQTHGKNSGARTNGQQQRGGGGGAVATSSTATAVRKRPRCNNKSDNSQQQQMKRTSAGGNCSTDSDESSGVKSKRWRLNNNNSVTSAACSTTVDSKSGGGAAVTVVTAAFPSPLTTKTSLVFSGLDSPSSASKSLLASRLATGGNKSGHAEQLGRKSSSDPQLLNSSRLVKDEMTTTVSSGRKKRNNGAAAAASRSASTIAAAANASGDKSSSPVVACQGDTLVILSDVTRACFNADGDEAVLLTQLAEADRRPVTSQHEKRMTGDRGHPNSKLSTNLQQDALAPVWMNNAKMNMPVLFRNCVKTYVKVKFVERTRVCRVCGYSVTVDGSAVTSRAEQAPASKQDQQQQQNGSTAGASELDLDSDFMSHVMEHSLKEIVESGGL